MRISSKTVALVSTAAIALCASTALAWTGPSGPPPSGNAAAPLNTSSTGQIKDGGLTLNYTGTGTSNGLIVYAGRVGIAKSNPSYSLDVNGTVSATAYLYSSDRRLKDNVEPLSDALKRITKLQGVTFTWKDTGRRDMGLIAQDVQVVFPEAVQKSETNGMLSVAYGNLVAPLIEAVKALARQNDTQDAEIAALKAQVAELQKEVAALKNL